MPTPTQFRDHSLESSLFSLLVMAPLAMIATLAMGCAPKNPAPAKYPEPRMIAVQNVGGPTIDFVELREIAKSNRPARLARVAPLSRGQLIVIPRQKNAPALPAEAEIIWSIGGVQRSETNSLTELIRASTGSPDEALMVTFGADGAPVVRLKNITP
jgi:hypothetical protein